MKRIYLDWAAAAPVTKGAERAYRRAAKEYGNPGAAHAEGRAAKAILEDARRAIAGLAGAKPDMVVFTSGATEANALAIRGLVKAHLLKGTRPEAPHLLYLPGMHASVDEAMRSLAKEGIATEQIPLSEGDVDLAALARLIRPETVLVSMEAVAPETGARYDTRSVRRVLDAARKEGGKRITLHADASQLPLVESFERTRLAADLISLDAQKVGGVRGIGCLIASPGVPLAPVIEGGGQEQGLRSGTQSPAAASAFAAALSEAARLREAFGKTALRARKNLVRGISAAIPDAALNEGARNVPHILNFSFPGRDTDYVAALLDEKGFAVSTKSACETDSPNGSRAVMALTGDPMRAASTIRVSWGSSTKDADVERFQKALIEAVAFVDRTRL